MQFSSEIDDKNNGWPDWNCLKFTFSRLISNLRLQYIKVGKFSREIDTY